VFSGSVIRFLCRRRQILNKLSNKIYLEVQMNDQCNAFVQFLLNDAPTHNKELVERAAMERFLLTKDRKVYHNDYFAVRFSYSKSTSASFSNTVLSLSALEKYDKIPFFVVLVRKCADNLVLLANSTFIKKISHSSQELSMTNIKGSFNGSDIMREYDGRGNSSENFDYLFAVHQGLDWADNLSRLVEATSQIQACGEKFQPSEGQRISIFDSIARSVRFIGSENFGVLRDDLNERCRKCKNEIMIASRIENINIRGRLIESLITSNDEERARISENLRILENALPTYDTRNGLGDYCRSFEDVDTLTDIKTKVVYLNSNPKAYNIDKFLRQMADNKSVFLFYFIGVDENGVFRTVLCSVYHGELIDNTILQFHWAGRSSRGAAQFSGVALDTMLRRDTFTNAIDAEKSKQFLKKLIAR